MSCTVTWAFARDKLWDETSSRDMIYRCGAQQKNVLELYSIFEQVLKFGNKKY